MQPEKSLDAEELSDAQIDRDLGVRVPSRRSLKRIAKELTAGRPKHGLRHEAARLALLATKIAMFPLLEPFHSTRAVGADGTIVKKKRAYSWRALNAAISRLLALPVILGLYFALIVYFTTHPARLHARQTPQSFNMFYRRVHITTTDGEHLAGWYVPPVTSSAILARGVRGLLTRHPAALLCHGLGQSADAYLPLARMLHRAGFAVLLLNLRGQGGSGPGTVTFGLLERRDVTAGVHYLLMRHAVDAQQIDVVGARDAANAALEAASTDPSIAAVVADGPFLLQRRIEHIFHAAGIAQDLFANCYIIAFDIMTHQRVGATNLFSVVRRIHQPVLFVARSSNVGALGDVLNLAGAKGRGGRFLGPGISGQQHHAVARRISAFLLSVYQQRQAAAKLHTAGAGRGPGLELAPAEH